MKKIIVLLFLLVPLCTKAQFDSNQAAFNWGRSLMLVVQGRQKLASQDYDGALETFREAFFDEGESKSFLPASGCQIAD